MFYLDSILSLFSCTTKFVTPKIHIGFRVDVSLGWFVLNMAKKKGGKAPYYVGAAQTLPRGMYSDRNKNAVGEYSLFSKCLSSLWFLAMMQKVC